MKWGRLLVMAALIPALGCGGGTPVTTAPRSSGSSDFARLCRAVGAEGGKISREDFLAKAKDKKAAGELFDACDVNQDQMVTREEAEPNYLESLKGQVIRLYTPRTR